MDKRTDPILQDPFSTKVGGPISHCTSHTTPKERFKIQWGIGEEETYQILMSILSNLSTLFPHDHNKPTPVVADATKYRMQASTYQQVNQKKREWANRNRHLQIM